MWIKVIISSFDLHVFALYKVVQIWPGQTVTCLHTISPGHIWTTLYLILQKTNYCIRLNNCNFGGWFIVMEFPKYKQNPTVNREIPLSVMMWYVTCDKLKGFDRKRFMWMNFCCLARRQPRMSETSEKTISWNVSLSHMSYVGFIFLFFWETYS
jgi:hypothetical protein